MTYSLRKHKSIIYLFEVADEHEVSIHAGEMVFADV